MAELIEMTPNRLSKRLWAWSCRRLCLGARFCWATPLSLSDPHSGCYSEGGARSHAPRRLSTRICRRLEFGALSVSISPTSLRE